MNLNHEIYWYLIPILLTLLIIEIAHLGKEKKLNKKDLLCTIGIIIGAKLIYSLLYGAILISYLFVYQYRIFNLGPVKWYAWIICFFADDFTYYWYHLINHKVRFFWASHIVHHSSEDFNLSTGLRIPWTSNITGAYLFWIWMPLLGIHPLMVLFMKGLSALYQFCLHTESIRRLSPWIETIFVTPSHHRVHHASDVDYLDKNFGGNLIIWDKIFGTFYKEEHQPKYGLTENIKSYNPVTVATAEWKKLFKDIKSSHHLKNGVLFLLNPPGWKPGDRSKTARQLQIELKELKEAKTV
jgi:sterol desaturase/sphingolipid hydroxylase (fatty acid hydroxylase superfamily)